MSYEISAESEELTKIREELDLPETVELLERPEEPREAIEAKTETTQIAEGLELEEKSGEGSEIRQEAPFTYSEAYVDENGRYHPEQITGVYTEVLENPGFREIAEDLGQWQQQEKRMSCAVQCQRMVINDLTGSELTESELRQQGKEQNLYQDEVGTYTEDVGKLAENYGLEREQFEDMSVPELMELKQQGVNLIVGVDAALLEYPELEKVSCPNHAVEVIGFDLSDVENPRVILNDPGRPDGRGSAYPMDIFEKAACAVNEETGEKTLHTVTGIYQKEGVTL